MCRLLDFFEHFVGFSTQGVILGKAWPATSWEKCQWMVVALLVQNFYTKKSGHGQDNLVCRRRPIIFKDQGNIGKLPSRRRMRIIVEGLLSTGPTPSSYSRLWLFQMRTAASGTEAESICLFRTSLSFIVEQNIVPILRECSPQAMCHVSHVTYHISPVACNFFNPNFLFFTKCWS